MRRPPIKMLALLAAVALATAACAPKDFTTEGKNADQMVKDEAQGFDISETQARFIGSGPHIAEGSPLRHAAAISAPVLLVHGDMDSNVGVAQSRKMSAALQSAGKQVEFIEFKGLDHQLNDNQARVRMLTKIGEMLERTIGH